MSLTFLVVSDGTFLKGGDSLYARWRVEGLRVSGLMSAVLG